MSTSENMPQFADANANAKLMRPECRRGGIVQIDGAPLVALFMQTDGGLFTVLMIVVIGSMKRTTN